MLKLIHRDLGSNCSMNKKLLSILLSCLIISSNTLAFANNEIKEIKSTSSENTEVVPKKIENCFK